MNQLEESEFDIIHCLHIAKIQLNTFLLTKSPDSLLQVKSRAISLDSFFGLAMQLLKIFPRMQAEEDLWSLRSLPTSKLWKERSNYLFNLDRWNKFSLDYISKLISSRPGKRKSTSNTAANVVRKVISKQSAKEMKKGSQQNSLSKALPSKTLKYKIWVFPGGHNNRTYIQHQPDPKCHQKSSVL